MVSFFVKSSRVVFLSFVLLLTTVSSIFAMASIEMTLEAREQFYETSGDKYLSWGTYKGF